MWDHLLVHQVELGEHRSENNQRFHCLIEAATGPVWLMDRHQRITYDFHIYHGRFFFNEIWVGTRRASLGYPKKRKPFYLLKDRTSKAQVWRLFKARDQPRVTPVRFI